MKQKNELGKGLRALLSTINSDATVPVDITENTKVNKVSLISVDKIYANKQQPRHVFDEELIQELAESIKTYGIIQPLTVRQTGDDRFQIISGERRFKASQLAGLREVPVYIRHANDNEMLEMALVENIQREDLNPVEIAISYQRLSDECGYTQEQLAERVGKKRSTISNYVRLLKLPVEVQTALKAKTITMGHARVIAGVDDLLMQMQLFKDIQKSEMSVRDAEKTLQNYQRSKARKPVKPSARSIDQTIEVLEKKMSMFFGYKVQIQRKESGEGQIVIKFKNDHQLNEILDRIDE
ncbi:MAG: ParB/RepB/Spo0J family partition protein [Saprospiraceae bacterium]|nr:ParB/RepB/Spo0J family partition protein [Saprospiraceae bacterium]